MVNLPAVARPKVEAGVAALEGFLTTASRRGLAGSQPGPNAFSVRAECDPGRSMRTGSNNGGRATGGRSPPAGRSMRSGRNDGGNPPGTPASAQLRPSPPPTVYFLCHGVRDPMHSSLHTLPHVLLWGGM